ncbi:MAG: DVU_2496 family lipoprotein [Desulfovibrionaceae bacterium]
MTVRNSAFFCLLACIVLAAGCVASSPNQGADTATPAASDQCENIYAYAPGAYIVNIVSGDAVILDPSSNDFFLFCSPEAAQKHLNKRIADRELPPGDWKVYHVFGKWEEIASEIGPNAYLLNVPAPIVDWVN